MYLIMQMLTNLRTLPSKLIAQSVVILTNCTQVTVLYSDLCTAYQKISAIGTVF